MKSVPRRRRIWRLALPGVVLLLVVSHPWWLREYGRYLAAERPLTKADAAVVVGGDHRLQKAAELFRNGTVSEVWLLEQEASYAVLAGILPASDAVEREHLMQLGVPASRIRVLNGSMRDVDDAARMIARAARTSPGTRLLLLCDRPHTRNMWWVMECVLGTGNTSHIEVWGLRDDEFDESNWWTSRRGWKETFNASCQMAYTLLRGVSADRPPFIWDADDYERHFVVMHGGAGCHAPD